MEFLLLVLYFVSFTVQVALLVVSVMYKKTWSMAALVILNSVSLLAAVLLWAYFKDAPGVGFMPGMTYFAETLFSFAAGAVYLVMLMIANGTVLYIMTGKKK